jgi:hypothetical protein
VEVKPCIPLSVNIDKDAPPLHNRRIKEAAFYRCPRSRRYRHLKEFPYETTKTHSRASQTSGAIQNHLYKLGTAIQGRENRPTFSAATIPSVIRSGRSVREEEMKGTLTYASDTPLLQLAAEWHGEHARYYGKPCGAKRVDAPHDFPAWASEQASYPPYPQRADLGLTLCFESVVWLRSSGAWAEIDFATRTLRFSGRRHSIRELIPDYCRRGCSHEYEQTQTPGLLPWETSSL